MMCRHPSRERRRDGGCNPSCQSDLLREENQFAENGETTPASCTEAGVACFVREKKKLFPIPILSPRTKYWDEYSGDWEMLENSGSLTSGVLVFYLFRISCFGFRIFQQVDNRLAKFPPPAWVFGGGAFVATLGIVGSPLS